MATVECGEVDTKRKNESWKVTYCTTGTWRGRARIGKPPQARLQNFHNGLDLLTFSYATVATIRTSFDIRGSRCFSRITPISPPDDIEHINDWAKAYSFCNTLAMIGLSYALALVCLLCGALFSGPVAVVARDTSVKSFHAKRLEAIKRWELSARDHDSEGNARRATKMPAPPRVKNITFSNPKASSEYATSILLPIVPCHSLLEYYVDGTTIPLVKHDVGPSWSGLIPISSSQHETRKVWL